MIGVCEQDHMEDDSGGQERQTELPAEAEAQDKGEVQDDQDLDVPVIRRGQIGPEGIRQVALLQRLFPGAREEIRDPDDEVVGEDPVQQPPQYEMSGDTARGAGSASLRALRYRP